MIKILNLSKKIQARSLFFTTHYVVIYLVKHKCILADEQINGQPYKLRHFGSEWKCKECAQGAGRCQRLGLRPEP